MAAVKKKAVKKKAAKKKKHNFYTVMADLASGKSPKAPPKKEGQKDNIYTRLGLTGNKSAPKKKAAKKKKKP